MALHSYLELYLERMASLTQFVKCGYDKELTNCALREISVSLTLSLLLGTRFRVSKILIRKIPIKQ
jgi:hypothetical protein